VRGFRRHEPRDEITELAALYALGGLEGEDRARFEAPPASVKAALLARIEAEERPAPRA